MANNNTLGEWSDGDDDWIFEIDENLREPNVSDEWSDKEEDELIRSINEEVFLRGLFGNDYLPGGSDEWSSSEDDELIRNINEDEILRGVNDNDEHKLEAKQTGRGEKRKAENQNVVLSDTEDDDPIPTIGDEGSNNQDEFILATSEEDEQSGRGVKRKAENQDVEQHYYQIKPVRDHHSQKFNMTAKNYSVHFNNVLDNVDLLESQNRTYGIFDHLIKDVTEGMNSYDQVRFVLSSNQLQTPIALPFCSLEELTTEKVLSQVEKVVQSNEEFRLNDTVNIDIIRVEMPQGSGRSRVKRQTWNIRDYLKKKGSVITINNRDNLCLARALVVSIARIEKDPRYTRIIRPESAAQRERAFDLHEVANVPLGPCGLKEVGLFQDYLVNYQIIVVSGDQDNAIIYPPHPPTNPNPEKSIYLYYQAKH